MSAEKYSANWDKGPEESAHHPYVEIAQILEDAIKTADRWTEPETIALWREEAEKYRRWAEDDEVYEADLREELAELGEEDR